MCKFDGKNWSSYTTSNTKNGLINNTVLAITVDNNGNQWFGTWGGGIAVLTVKTGADIPGLMNWEVMLSIHWL